MRPVRAHRLPPALRHELAVPFGPVLSTEGLRRRLRQLPEDAPLAAVGDIVSRTLKELGRTPAFFVCDYKTQRGEDAGLVAALASWGDVEARVVNPAAEVGREAWDAVAAAWRRWADTGTTTRIVVTGEEDLLGIPAFLEAPDGAVVVYGMPGEGVVWVEVDEACRRRVSGLLARFDQD